MKKSIIASACMLVVVSSVLAVKPVTWTHSTEAEFASGELTKTVVTSLGEVKLSRALETLVEPAEKTGMVSAVAIDKRGEVYLAAAPKATVYRLEGNKLVEFAQLPGVLVRSMVFVGDGLVAGTCGKEAGIYRIDRKGKVKKVWADEKVASVWSVLPAPGGSFYAATGAEGKIYHVKADGKAEVIYDSDEKNILSLAAGRGGLLYAGTGEDGLIIELTPATKKGRILYDAEESEISCLLVDSDGILYAAASDASKASADGETPSDEIKGKPDKTTPAEPDDDADAEPASKPATSASDMETLKKATTILPAAPEIKNPETAPARQQVPPEILRRMAAAMRGSASSRPTPSEPTEPEEGNAVYRIDKAGFVQAVFRRPVAIFSMVMHEGVLVLGTGHGGQVFTVGTDGEQICAIAKLDPKDVTILAVDPKGRLYIGTAGAGGLFALGKGFSGKGTYISKVFDAEQIARWGTMNVSAETPAGCGVTIATRSGNVAEPDEKTWSNWSVETIVAPGWLPITCPAGRFIQYRLTLVGEGKATPSVNKVDLVHQVGNLAPVVSAVQVDASSEDEDGEETTGPMRFRTIQAQASDPNDDALLYEFFFRQTDRKKWIKLLKESPEPMYAWNTLTVPDGTYEVRVEVSDVADNAPSAALTAARISRPIVIDNSQPKATDLAVKNLGKGSVSLSGQVDDALSPIRQIDYSVDSNDKWVTILPTDGICDSQKEAFSATVSDLEAGTHRIAVRVTDAYNNTGYASVEVTIGK